MTVRRMGHGLAFQPDADLAMFREMAAQGYRLAGSDVAGRWTFEPAAPEDVEFAITHEPATGADLHDYLALFEDAGWHHVLTLGVLHVFKAAPGTPPVHSSPDTVADELSSQRRRYVRATAVALALFLLVLAVVLIAQPARWLTATLLVVAVVPLVYTALPLAAYWWRTRHLTD